MAYSCVRAEQDSGVAAVGSRGIHILVGIIFSAILHSDPERQIAPLKVSLKLPGQVARLYQRTLLPIADASGINALD